jgi:hypothetical protein
MSKTYRAIMIDPDARSVTEINWDGSHDTMHELIGADTLDHFTMAMWEEDRHTDHGWVDDDGLKAGKPIQAFLLPLSKDPIAGKCLIVGADERGETADARLPLRLLLQDATWLGTILPEVHWEHTAQGSRAIVLYERLEARQ